MLHGILEYFQSIKILQTNTMTEITSSHWLSNKLKWCPTTASALEDAERKVLSYVKRPYLLKFREILSDDGKSLWKIRTLMMNEQNREQKTPLVMLHGLGAAVGFWILNLDALSEKRPLYACDLLGFGMSSRPTFSTNATEVKEQYVRSIELWRQEIGIEKFILLGHSMGGYLATAYALKYPQHVQHLILAEPWGFPEQGQIAQRSHFPLWAKFVISVANHFAPFAGLRMAGPWGPGLVEKMRPDLLQKYSPVLRDTNEIANYIYHCNVQTPSGEVAFKTLCKSFGWAKEPMIPRIDELHKDIPITFLYGAESWMDYRSGHIVKEIRNQSDVAVHVIEGAGHHVNADHPTKFNCLVQKICEDVDKQIAPDSREKSKNNILDYEVIEHMADFTYNL